MEALVPVRTTLAAAASLIVCALMAGCGAGSGASSEASSPIMVGTVTGTENPLVAIYTIRTGCSGQMMVEFGPTTSYGRSTGWYRVTTSSSVEVAGMKASTTYHMRAQVQCNGTTKMSPDTSFTTGPLPSSSHLAFPQLVVSRPNPSLSATENPGIEYIDVTVSQTPPFPAFFTDRDGNVIWYYDMGPGNFAFPFKLLPNGNILVSLTNAVTVSNLREIDLAGNTIRELTTLDLQHKMADAESYDFVPAGFHHDFALLPNGHVVVMVACYKAFTNLPGHPGTITVQGDALVDLDENWNPTWAWNAFDYLDVNRAIDGLPDWTHTNAILYSSDGNLILSLRNQSWILKIDYENGTGSGNILWHLGNQGDFALTNEGVPSDDLSLWFADQHFPIILSQNGSQTTLAMFDNGDRRVLDTEGAECINPVAGNAFPPCHSRPVIFQIDESSMVANITWADPLPYFSIWGGAINQFSNGNVEFDLNDPAISPSPNLASQVQEVTGTSPPQVLWQMDLFPAAANAYRAYRFPSLYNGVTWQY